MCISVDSHTSSYQTWKISRYGFFTLVCCVSFCWYWFPDFIFPALSYFNFPCWIRPKSPVVNQVFGMKSGMGLLPITFDCKFCRLASRIQHSQLSQGVKYPTWGPRCSFRHGRSSMSSYHWYFGYGSWQLLAIIQTSGLPGISLSRAPKVCDLTSGSEITVNHF